MPETWRQLGGEGTCSNDLPANLRTYRTWRCSSCGAEFDQFTYGGPCPLIGCGGDLHHQLSHGITLPPQPDVACQFCFAEPGQPCANYRLSVRQTAG